MFYYYFIIIIYYNQARVWAFFQYILGWLWYSQIFQREVYWLFLYAIAKPSKNFLISKSIISKLYLKSLNNRTSFTAEMFDWLFLPPEKTVHSSRVQV